MAWWVKFDPKNEDHCRRLLEEDLKLLADCGITHLRTGVSWADWMTPAGKSWIIWSVRRSAEKFRVLPCLTFTPPHLGIRAQINSPPSRPLDYADFVGDVMVNLGDCFEEVELWNEWNLYTDWDNTLDPEYRNFSLMISLGALVLRRFGKKPVLGGVSNLAAAAPLLRLMVGRGVTALFEVVGFHNLRGTWSDERPPPSLSQQEAELGEVLSAPPDQSERGRLLEEIRMASIRADSGIRPALDSAPAAMVERGSARIWLTEYGFPPFDPYREESPEVLEEIQAGLFLVAAETALVGELERMYWYTLRDQGGLSIRHLTTGWEDILQYYYGAFHSDGRPKLLGRLLREGGAPRVVEYGISRGWCPDEVNRAASLKRKKPVTYVSNFAPAKKTPDA